MTRPSTSHSSSSYESSSSAGSTICTPTSASGLGARKIHFNPHSDWDFIAATDSEPVDLDLLLPHYRAVNQPRTHRLSMYVHSRHGEVKAKVCRTSRAAPFLLSVHAPSGAPVTLYLPSDFAGTIRLPVRPAKLALSAGFTNAIQPRVMLAGAPRREGEEAYDMDEVEVYASGPVTLRMWDVCEGTPERAAREAWRKLCRATSKRDLSRAGDWDFLLDD